MRPSKASCNSTSFRRSVHNFRLPESVCIPTCNYHLDHRPKIVPSSLLIWRTLACTSIPRSSSTLTRGFPSFKQIVTESHPSPPLIIKVPSLLLTLGRQRRRDRRNRLHPRPAKSLRDIRPAVDDLDNRLDRHRRCHSLHSATLANRLRCRCDGESAGSGDDVGLSRSRSCDESSGAVAGS